MERNNACSDPCFLVVSGGVPHVQISASILLRPRSHFRRTAETPTPSPPLPPPAKAHTSLKTMDQNVAWVVVLHLHMFFTCSLSSSGEMSSGPTIKLPSLSYMSFFSGIYPSTGGSASALDPFGIRGNACPRRTGLIFLSCSWVAKKTCLVDSSQAE